jgi:hypothetical protein
MRQKYTIRKASCSNALEVAEPTAGECLMVIGWALLARVVCWPGTWVLAAACVAVWALV